MKVLEFVSMLSDIPILVNRRSTGRKAANSAGTKQPTCRCELRLVNMQRRKQNKHEQQAQEQHQH